MRIGINGRFLAARLTGVQRFAHELCRRLYSRAEVVMFVPGNARVDAIPGDVRVMRGTLRGQAWEQFELPRASVGLVDLVLHPANSAPLSGGPHAIVLHDVLPLTHPEWFARKYVLWHSHVTRAAAARASVIFTCSAWSAREIETSCRIPLSRIRVIPQGLEPFDAPAERTVVEATLAELRIHQPYVLAVGAGDPRKNIAWLIEVVQEVRRSHPNLTLVAVGSHASRVHGADTEAKPHWVHSPGNVSDPVLRALYTGAAAFCFPSLEEGFGRSPIEALACGTPALVGAYGAAIEVLGDSVPILEFDQALWVRALADVLDRPDARAALVQRGTELLRRFSWDTCADRVVEGCLAAVERPFEVTA